MHIIVLRYVYFFSDVTNGSYNNYLEIYDCLVATLILFVYPNSIIK